MKKITRTALLGTSLLLSLVTIAGCSAKNQELDTTEHSSSTLVSTVKAEVAVSVSLLQDGKELSQKSFTVPSETNLMTALQANFEVIEEGGMITSIEGIEQDTAQNLYWTYTINDEMVNTGANETQLNDGDKVVFTYEKF